MLYTRQPENGFPIFRLSYLVNIITPHPLLQSTGTAHYSPFRLPPTSRHAFAYLANKPR